MTSPPPSSVPSNEFGGRIRDNNFIDDFTQVHHRSEWLLALDDLDKIDFVDIDDRLRKYHTRASRLQLHGLDVPKGAVERFRERLRAARASNSNWRFFDNLTISDSYFAEGELRLLMETLDELQLTNLKLRWYVGAKRMMNATEIATGLRGNRLLRVVELESRTMSIRGLTELVKAFNATNVIELKLDTGYNVKDDFATIRPLIVDTVRVMVLSRTGAHDASPITVRRGLDDDVVNGVEIVTGPAYQSTAACVVAREVFETLSNIEFQCNPSIWFPTPEARVDLDATYVLARGIRWHWTICGRCRPDADDLRNAIDALRPNKLPEDVKWRICAFAGGEELTRVVRAKIRAREFWGVNT